MKSIDLIPDICFLVLGIACTVFVIVKRKRFDIWMSLFACAAWITKGIRLLYYDWHIITMETMRNAGQDMHAFIFAQKAHLALAGMDALTNLFLFASFVRLIIVGLHWHWYRKAITTLNK